MRLKSPKFAHSLILKIILSMFKSSNYSKIIVFIFVVFSSSVFAQTSLSDSARTATMTKGLIAPTTLEGERLMSLGAKNSISLDIMGVPIKYVNKKWKDYAKQFKGDIKNKNDEWFSDNALIPAIGGANTVDMYAKFAENGQNTTATVWFDLGGAYLNSKDFADKYKEGEKILTAFNLSVQRDMTADQLNDQQEALKKLEKNQRNLERKNTDLHSDIEDYKKKIAKAENDIQINLKQQDDSKKQVENQRKLVDEIQKKLNMLN